ncbi:hypothetical protein N9E94_00080 [bacterium]|nr:hypothetical protein [bacterium]
MFGFGRKAKLRKLSDGLKGASLQEVVEQYADASLIQRPALPYDENIALIYKENITSDEEQNTELLVKKLRKITDENHLPDGSENIYLAYSTFNNLRTYAFDLTMATKFMSSHEEAVKYLFETWLKIPPVYYLIPILFPAKSGGRIEDFSIDRNVRYAMLEEFLSRADSMSSSLSAEDVLKEFVNEFASEHPYFRLYPL